MLLVFVLPSGREEKGFSRSGVGPLGGQGHGQLSFEQLQRCQNPNVNVSQIQEGFSLLPRPHHPPLP